jgi:hypothetical protein
MAYVSKQVLNMNESRCGLCNVPVNAQDFKAHVKSFSHLINQHQMVQYWAKLNIIHMNLVEGIKNGSITRI